jgi:hypothetical protein
MKNERTWKLGEPGAAEVCDKNVRLLDELRARLSKQCGHCRWPISAIRDETFGCAEYGDICKLCHELYGVLTFSNLQLKNTMYFRALHTEWQKKENERKEREKKFRERLGLDGDNEDGIA